MARILIADDEPLLRKLLGLLLRPEGHEVAEAADGAEALHACRAAPFDLLLCDLLMPNMEGLETIQAARREFPGLKIVAMSGRVRCGGDLLKVAGLTGADAALAKPFSREDLLGALAEFVGAAARTAPPASEAREALSVVPVAEGVVPRRLCLQDGLL